jgi:hypothetical protein
MHPSAYHNTPTQPERHVIDTPRTSQWRLLGLSPLSGERGFEVRIDVATDFTSKGNEKEAGRVLGGYFLPTESMRAPDPGTRPPSR